jgi:uncharacterized membrane protein YfcA
VTTGTTTAVRHGHATTRLSLDQGGDGCAMQSCGGVLLLLSWLCPCGAVPTTNFTPPPSTCNHSCPRMEVCVAPQHTTANNDTTTTAAGCEHKPLLPLNLADIQTAVALFFGLSLASAGGVGGGALVVPILILLENFGPSATVPFAQLCGFTTALPRLAMVVAKRHPRDPSRPLIDFESFVILTPATLIGNLVGVHMNVTSPAVLLLTVMVLLLSVVGVRLLKKGLAMWRADSAWHADTAAASAPETAQPLLGGKTAAGTLLSEFGSIQNATGGEEAAGVYQQRQGACAAVLSVALLFATISILSYLRGAPGRPSPIGVGLCSLQFWALDVGSGVALCVHLAFGATMAARRHRPVSACARSSHRSHERQCLPACLPAASIQLSAVCFTLHLIQSLIQVRALPCWLD